MIKKILLIILLLISFSKPALAERDILVIQSVKISPYEDALNGFLSVTKFNIRRIILSKLKKFDLAEDIRKARPSLILAIGRDALMNVKEVKDIPVVCMMVLAPQSILAPNENFYGISMNIPPEKQLEIYISAIPGLNNIGLIYNPNNTGNLVENALGAAEKKGVRLIAMKAKKASEVPSVLKDISDKIHAFWMLPDITLMTPESIEFLLITSIEKNIPILTFSPKYVEMGALISISVDPYDMGKQAGELAQKIITDENKKVGKIIPARKGVITFNDKVAEKLGITLNQEAPSHIEIKK